MKAVPSVKHRKASSGRHKVRPRAKKNLDLSWLIDRPLPPENELIDNYVIVMRNRQ